MLRRSPGWPRLTSPNQTFIVTTAAAARSIATAKAWRDGKEGLKRLAHANVQIKIAALTAYDPFPHGRRNRCRESRFIESKASASIASMFRQRLSVAPMDCFDAIFDGLQGQSSKISPNRAVPRSSPTMRGAPTRMDRCITIPFACPRALPRREGDRMRSRVSEQPLWETGFNAQSRWTYAWDILDLCRLTVLGALRSRAGLNCISLATLSRWTVHFSHEARSGRPYFPEDADLCPPRRLGAGEGGARFTQARQSHTRAGTSFESVVRRRDARALSFRADGLVFTTLGLGCSIPGAVTSKRVGDPNYYSRCRRTPYARPGPVRSV